MGVEVSIGSSAPNASNLIWLDLEMTGLDPERHTILEIGMLATDAQLSVLADGPCLTIKPSEQELDAIEAWSFEHHTKSGLLQQAKEHGVTMEKAERQALEFVHRYCPERSAPLCGNSVWYDRRFLIRYMPRLNNYLHHRNVDVSTIKELADRWYPSLKPPAKRKTHRVMDDLRESLDELRFYRQRIFAPT